MICLGIFHDLYNTYIGDEKPFIILADTIIRLR